MSNPQLYDNLIGDFIDASLVSECFNGPVTGTVYSITTTLNVEDDDNITDLVQVILTDDEKLQISYAACQYDSSVTFDNGLTTK